jgi:hypothetical protein
MWKWLRWAVIALCGVIVLGIIVLNVYVISQSARATAEPPRELVYVVPQGTIGKLGIGLTAAILPNQVELVVGGQDTLVIRNQDLYPIDVGGVLIHPGQEFRQQFTRAGTFDLMCSVHADEKIRVIVKPPQ